MPKKKTTKIKVISTEESNTNSVHSEKVATNSQEIDSSMKPAPKQAFITDNIKHKSSIGCFGFVSTWITRRKEKRRQKKRQAIKARESHSMVSQLKRCERGGVAYIVEFDQRVTKKPVLSPTKSKPEPSNFDHDKKMFKAERNRQAQLPKRMRFIRAQREKRQVVEIENAERKFRQGTISRPARGSVLSRDHSDYDDDADIISPYFSSQLTTAVLSRDDTDYDDDADIISPHFSSQPTTAVLSRDDTDYDDDADVIFIY
ncbi:hypothetical protein ACF0H5_022951 [Mactra antiquata]